MKGSFRTKKEHDRYAAYLKKRAREDGCPLCQDKETIKGFRYWRIVENTFPYNRIAKIHHMLLPHRHVTENMLTAREKSELQKIKHSYVNREYEFIFESTHRTKSIPAHHHLHLITVKD